MSKFIIEGQHKLSGEIKVAGNKNASLPIIAATILTDEECVLKNVPDIRDVHAMLRIAEDLGKTVTKTSDNSYVISGKTTKSIPDTELVQRLRASILFFGALISKTGEAQIAPPGGCVIGRRQMSPHFEALSDMGVSINVEDEYYGRLNQNKDSNIFLREASVTATENALQEIC